MNIVFKKIHDWLSHLFPHFILGRILKKLEACVDDGVLDNFMFFLLWALEIIFRIDPEFRRNIEHFEARYTFRNQSGTVADSAIFHNGRMRVKHKALEETTITVIFKDSRSIWEFLLSGNPDVFAFILENKLSYIGNINYVMKFAYMAKHLQLAFGLKAQPKLQHA